MVAINLTSAASNHHLALRSRYGVNRKFVPHLNQEKRTDNLAKARERSRLDVKLPSLWALVSMPNLFAKASCKMLCSSTEKQLVLITNPFGV